MMLINYLFFLKKNHFFFFFKNDQLREKRATEICIVKYLLSIIPDPGNDKKSKVYYHTTINYFIYNNYY
jgi:hypothetical protein